MFKHRTWRQRTCTAAGEHEHDEPEPIKHRLGIKHRTHTEQNMKIQKMKIITAHQEEHRRQKRLYYFYSQLKIK